MVKFLTLYLGLLTGSHPVEVIVADDVASVEFLLDGDGVGVVASEPWRLEVDLGPALLPHGLEAVAYDEERREIARAQQLLNVPRPAAEAAIVLERDAGGQVVRARVSWQSALRDRPLETVATLDGRPLPVSNPASIAIPDHDGRSFHFLEVELSFSDRVRAQAVAAFGGAHASEVSTELTALPVLPSGRRRTSIDQIEGSVLKKGRPIRVVSIDVGQGDVLFVRDIEAGKIIDAIGRGEADGLGGGMGISSATGIGTGSAVVPGVSASADEQLRDMLRLDADVRVRLMWPATKSVERQKVRMDLFPASPPTTAKEDGVFWALTRPVVLDGTSDIQRLTDAVAVAGLEAAAANRRRAVVLVLGPESIDHSLYEPAAVREFLRALHVPLYVWAVGVARKASVYPEWGEVRNVGSLRDLQRAVRELEKDLDRQRILWVAGRHLPHHLELAPGAAVTRVTP